MISPIEIANWKTTRPRRRNNPRVPPLNRPFNESIGRKPDKTNAG